MASSPGPEADLIEHAAGIIVASRKLPHTAPGHWAGALWEAGMLVSPGTANLGQPTRAEIEQILSDHAVGRHVPKEAVGYRAVIADAILALLAR